MRPDLVTHRHNLLMCGGVQPMSVLPQQLHQ